MTNTDGTCTVRLSRGMASKLADLGHQLGPFGATRPRTIETLLLGHPTGPHALACMMRYGAGVDPSEVLVPPGADVRSGYQQGIQAGRREADAEARACRRGLLMLISGPHGEEIRAELVVHGIEVAGDDTLGLVVRDMKHGG